MAFWLMKSEPDAFSIDDLASRPKGLEPWNGVRNYQARNFMRDEMEIGDHAFFYHSSCEEPGIVGLMRIASRAYPDPTQFDRKSPYYDPKSTPEEPRWFLVDVRFERRLARNITLTELRRHEKDLRGLPLLARGSRLSVIPVRPEHWDYIVALENV
jgi:predicted RNA-binding protein with PUA-like domain